MMPRRPVAATQRARDLAAAGQDIIALTVSEPDFDTPEHVREAAVAAIARGDIPYTNVDGTAALKHAIVGKFHREKGIRYDPSEVIVTAGARPLIFNAFMATIDEVMIPTPCWVSLDHPRAGVRLAARRVLRVSVLRRTDRQAYACRHCHPHGRGLRRVSARIAGRAGSYRLALRPSPLLPDRARRLRRWILTQTRRERAAGRPRSDDNIVERIVQAALGCASHLIASRRS